MVDAGTLEEVLSHIHNWFPAGTASVEDCEISGGALPASVSATLLDGQWYRIQGSILNDGLHLYRSTYPSGQSSDLEDETFDGTITSLAIPKVLLGIVEEIQQWIADYKAAREYLSQTASKGAYQSESFGGYSYAIRGDLASNSGSGGSGGLSGWQAEFASRLSPWRKMY